MADPVPESTLSRIMEHHGLPGPYTFTPVPTGLFNTTYIAGSGEGELILRIAPRPGTKCVYYEQDMMIREAAAHPLLREHTGLPVPAILKYDESRSLIDRNYMIMEKMPGTLLTYAHHLSPEQFDGVLEQTGKLLAELHAFTAPQFGYPGRRKPVPLARTWGEVFSLMWMKMVDNVAECGGYSVKEADHMKKMMFLNEPLFRMKIKPSFCHNDVWHQNIMVDDAGTVTGLIDWDRGLWADPGMEFVKLDYAGMSQPALWKGYGREPDPSPEAKKRRDFYLLFELQKYIVIHLTRRYDQGKAAAFKNKVWAIAVKMGA